MEILVTITVCLTVSFAFAELFKRIRYPEVIGQIFAGIFLGLPFIKDIFFYSGTEPIHLLSELGMVFMMLLAGMDTDIKKIKKSSKEIISIAVLSALIPFVMGFAVMKLLGYSNVAALVVGSVLSLTAESTKIKVLLWFHRLRTRLGSIMLGAGIMDDVFEVLFLALVLVIAHHGSQSELFLFPVKIAVFILFAILIFKFLPNLLKTIVKKQTEETEFTTTLILGLSIAIFSMAFGLGPVIGAYIAGVIIQYSFSNKRECRKMTNDFKVLTFGLIVPFFFVEVGLNFNILSLLVHWKLAALIFIIGVVGKMLGTIIVHFFSNLKLTQTFLIGWAMNSRGATDLIILQIAYSSDLIPHNIYSSIVFMTIFSSLLFPIAMKHYLDKYPNIMG